MLFSLGAGLFVLLHGDASDGCVLSERRAQGNKSLCMIRFARPSVDSGISV